MHITTCRATALHALARHTISPPQRPTRTSTSEMTSLLLTQTTNNATTRTRRERGERRRKYRQVAARAEDWGKGEKMIVMDEKSGYDVEEAQPQVHPRPHPFPNAKGVSALASVVTLRGSSPVKHAGHCRQGCFWWRISSFIIFIPSPELEDDNEAGFGVEEDEEHMPLSIEIPVSSALVVQRARGGGKGANSDGYTSSGVVDSMHVEHIDSFPLLTFTLLRFCDTSHFVTHCDWWKCVFCPWGASVWKLGIATTAVRGEDGAWITRFLRFMFHFGVHVVYIESSPRPPARLSSPKSEDGRVNEDEEESALEDPLTPLL
ncbi:hypothetical protein BDQ17DRAFT_1410890 [Cyathus striatus]|nr:hypothetical protein BDQ17DRAFT_1410890 [Cyathus striatus]